MLAMLCGCLAVWSAALVYSDLAMSYPRTVVAGWEQGAPMLEYTQQRSLLRRMGHAIAVNPMSGRERMDLGRFFAWHAARQRIGSPRAKFYQRLAADRFAEAVLARPTWGYAWVLLAEQWSAIGQPDERVLHALRRAVQLAPREPGVQLKSLWLGLGNWRGIDVSMRQQLADSLQRLTARRAYFDKAVGIVLQHKQLGLLEGLLTHRWQIEALERLQQVRRKS